MLQTLQPRHGCQRNRFLGGSPWKFNRSVSQECHLAVRTKKKNRKLKIMSTYVDLMYASHGQGKPGTPRWVPTRAAEEPLAMLELLVAKCLEGNFETVQSPSTHVNKDSLTRPKIHPLRMLSIFKERLKSEDKILRFDLLTLNERCVEMLRKAQAVCVEESPLDYPRDEYDVILN